MAPLGLGLTIGGGFVLVGAAAKKHEIKRKYRYSLSPMIDPENQRYGLSLAMDF